MRISESRIRQIIREEARRALQEMPYAGSLGLRKGTPDWDPGEDEWGDPRRKAKLNIPGAERFVRSGRFKSQAAKLYANFPSSIWIASWAGDPRELRHLAPELSIGLGGEYTGEIRVASMDLVPDGIRALERVGFEAPARVGSNDLVIVHSIADVDRENLSTPWMIFHSIFDDLGSAPADFVPSWDDLEMLRGGLFDDLKFKDGTPVDDTPDDLGRIFTMGSARSGRLEGFGNAAAEAICQELLTRGGFRYKSDDLDDGSIGIMEKLKDQVKQAADEFRRSAQGKLLAVATS
jgi:hypothetical protein